MRQLQPRDQAIVATAAHGAVLFGRDDWIALAVTGRDRIKFLHNMLTQDVTALATGGSALACLCDAQGAVVATLLLVVEPGRVVAWVPRRQAQLLQESLDKFIIADDVDLAVDDGLALLELMGPSAPQLAVSLSAAAPTPMPMPVQVSDATALVWSSTGGGAQDSPWGPALPTILWQLPRDELGTVAAALLEAGATAGSHAAREALRIAEGSAALGDDVADGSLPIEFGLKAAVSFRKGCYLGQEAIAMMTYRGQIRRHLCWVSARGPQYPEAGWQLRTSDGKRAGRMGSSVRDADGRWLGLAMVQRKAYTPGGALEASDGDLTCAVEVLGTTTPGVLDAKPAPTEAA